MRIFECGSRKRRCTISPHGAIEEDFKQYSRFEVQTMKEPRSSGGGKVPFRVWLMSARYLGPI